MTRNAFLHLLFVLLLITSRTVAQTGTDSGSVAYVNAVQKISVIAPAGWVEQDHEFRGLPVFIAQWILPKIYSELEKTSIANAVTITSLALPEIQNLQNLVYYEFNRIGDVLTKKERLDGDELSYIVYTTIDGLEYKTKYYFLFKEGKGYVVNFTATPGTYDRNLSRFEAFYRTLKLGE